MVHLDVKKLGKITDGCSWRIRGCSAGKRNSLAHTPVRRNSRPVIGDHYLHTALDDHSRLAYAELLTDECKDTAAAFWLRTEAYFAHRSPSTTAA
jgi:hypothetical protein